MGKASSATGAGSGPWYPPRWRRHGAVSPPASAEGPAVSRFVKGRGICRSPSASSPIDAWNGSVAMATLRHTERRALLHDVPRVCLVIAPVVNRHGTAWRIVAGASPAVNVNSYHQRRQGSTPHGLGKLHELDRVIHESRLSLDGIGSRTAEQQATCSASHGHPHTLPRYIDIPLTTSLGV